MSRWRETLCGSSIKSCNLPLENQAQKFSDAHPTLSCGGSYLPTYQGYRVRHFRWPTILHLPTSAYDVMVYNPISDPQRYRENIDRFFDMDPAEGRLDLMDVKPTK